MERCVVVCAALLLVAIQAPALDLVKDGKAVSAIVVPDTATPQEQEGAQTLARYLQMSSGADLPIVKESDKPAGALVSVGKTQMAQEAGITDAGLKYDGYRLVVRGATLYLVGRDTDLIGDKAMQSSGRRGAGIPCGAQGTARAAFGLLDRLGFRWLQPARMGTYVPELTTVSVPDDLNVTYEPPFMYVHSRFVNEGDWSMANSFRTAVKLFTGGGHTWHRAVPASLFDEHPEYFAMRNGERVRPVPGGYSMHMQYCCTNPDLPKLIAEWMVSMFDRGYDIVQLGPSDGFKACQCEECSKISSADAVHNVHRRVAEIVGVKYPDRKVHILVYPPAIGLPKQFAAYPPNVMTEVCLTGRVMDEFGGSHEKAMDSWREAVPGGMTVYAYNMGLYHKNGLSPRFIPELAAEKIRGWRDHGVEGIFWCGGGDNWGAEGPTYYVIARMINDPELDWNAAYEEYLNLTFRNAAPVMKQYYDLIYQRLKMQRHHHADWVVAGYGSALDSFAPVYTADVLLKLKAHLEAAKQQAAGNERALAWIRLAEISYNHFALIATAFHYYQAYMLNPTPENLAQVADAVKAYQAWADETIQLAETDKAFVEDFFPSFGSSWGTPRLSVNHGMGRRRNLNAAPFNWDFERKQPGTR